MQKTTVTYMTQVIIIGVMGFVIFLFGCAASNRQLPMPEQLIAQGVITEGVDATILLRGRALAVTECTSCHRFYWPQDYPPEAWRGIAKLMGKRASLSKTQIKDLELYFVGASRAAQEFASGSIKKD
jgi:hypothetical protein